MEDDILKVFRRLRSRLSLYSQQREVIALHILAGVAKRNIARHILAFHFVGEITGILREMLLEELSNFEIHGDPIVGTGSWIRDRSVHLLDCNDSKHRIFHRSRAFGKVEIEVLTSSILSLAEELQSVSLAMHSEVFLAILQVRRITGCYLQEGRYDKFRTPDLSG